MKVEIDTDQLRRDNDAALDQAKVAQSKQLATIQEIEHFLSKRLQIAQNVSQGVGAGRDWTTLRFAIREACDKLKQVSANSAMEYINANFAAPPDLTETSVASTLRKLLGDGELRRVREASPGQATIYELVDGSRQEG